MAVDPDETTTPDPAAVLGALLDEDDLDVQHARDAIGELLASGVEAAAIVEAATDLVAAPAVTDEQAQRLAEIIDEASTTDIDDVMDRIARALDGDEDVDIDSLPIDDESKAMLQGLTDQERLPAAKVDHSELVVDPDGVDFDEVADALRAEGIGPKGREMVENQLMQHLVSGFPVVGIGLTEDGRNVVIDVSNGAQTVVDPYLTVDARSGRIRTTAGQR